MSMCVYRVLVVVSAHRLNMPQSSTIRFESRCALACISVFLPLFICSVQKIAVCICKHSVVGVMDSM